MNDLKCLAFSMGLLVLGLAHEARPAFNPNPPAASIKLIFIHHSSGENWLNDENGRLGIALMENNYYVSDTNYGWGPDSIGDSTDIGQWWLWFRSHESPTYMEALFGESGQNCWYSRLDSDPEGENEIVMFKSCFPNSALQGDPDDPVPAIEDNPLVGEGSWSEYHTVANAKGIYIDLLNYFRTRQDKLFIAITAPPLTDPTYASNARAFNQWLVNDWLKGYPYHNVAVFDFYNVLTTNGGMWKPTTWIQNRGTITDGGTMRSSIKRTGTTIPIPMSPSIHRARTTTIRAGPAIRRPPANIPRS